MSLLRIVQLTDCHLFADQSRSLRDIPTWHRFKLVLEKLRQQISEFDLIVLTGDTAHDEDQKTYEAVRTEFAEMADLVCVVPGNHDNRNGLKDIFSGLGDGPKDRVTFHRRWSDWQVIGLDSQRPGELPGSLGQEQLDWLSGQLDQSKTIPTLLFLHHPPVAVRSPWLDKIGLLDAADFEDLLRSHPQVKLIGCGHVHQQMSASFANATVFTTPAVGPPFRPRTDELQIDQVPPSYRVWELFDNGRWSTQVLY